MNAQPTAREKKWTVGLVAASCLFFLHLSGWTFDLAAPSDPAALKVHVTYLASPELTGRGVDTPGINLARDYISGEFSRYGLQPGGDDGTFLQSFELTTGVAVKDPTTFALDINKPLSLNEDWAPIGLSASGMVSGELVFAGYGITAKDYPYDDYADIDARGKIVVVLRYEPPPKNDKSPFRKAPRYSNYATLRAKADNAREHGAVGMILVDVEAPRAGARELVSTRNSYARGENKVVALQIKRALFEPWLAARGFSLAQAKQAIDRNEKPASQVLSGISLTATVTLEQRRQRAENVIAVLPGSDAKLKHEAIVIGAHYDHLGYGYFGTRDASTEGQIHHGADDNASGTAVLIEVARHLARTEPKPARTIVFAAFSGEELGLLGSRHYVNFPTVRLSATKAMLNMDMVGRLRNDRLTVFGTRSAQELSAIVLEEARRHGLQITESDGVGRSDHMSFYNRKIPALHFFTGSHTDYHRPSDTAEKINQDGLARVANLVATVAQRVANGRDSYNFVSLPARPPAKEANTSPGYGVYLGSIPDFSETGAGVKLAGVTAGSPAELGGLREGDVIVEFAGSKVTDLEGLAQLLGSKKPGDDVGIVVQRNGAAITLRVTLRARS